MTRTHEANADPYAAHRCATCGHFPSWHEGDRCFAGEHTVPCRCEGFLPVEMPA